MVDIQSATAENRRGKKKKDRKKKPQDENIMASPQGGHNNNKLPEDMRFQFLFESVQWQTGGRLWCYMLHVHEKQLSIVAVIVQQLAVDPYKPPP